MNLGVVSEIVARYGADKTASLAILQDIQNEFKYLPRAALEEAARQLDMPISDLYRMSTFFKAFSLQPRGENVVKVCMGTACHVRGGPAILDTLERELGLQAGNTSADGKFTLEAVRCVGACALGPIVLVNEEPHGNMTRSSALKLVQGVAEQAPSEEKAETASLDASGPVDLSAVPPTGSKGG